MSTPSTTGMGSSRSSRGPRPTSNGSARCSPTPRPLRPRGPMRSVPARCSGAITRRPARASGAAATMPSRMSGSARSWTTCSRPRCSTTSGLTRRPYMHASRWKASAAPRTRPSSVAWATIRPRDPWRTRSVTLHSRRGSRSSPPRARRPGPEPHVARRSRPADGRRRQGSSRPRAARHRSRHQARPCPSGRPWSPPRRRRPP